MGDADKIASGVFWWATGPSQTNHRSVKLWRITSGSSTAANLPTGGVGSPMGAAILSPDQQQELISPFTEEEVQATIRGLNSEVAPGPDGIPVFFYLDCWDVVGPDVLAMIDEFWACWCNMDRLNRAYIILLSKVEGTERIGDFRPISLSNSIYLIITKVLANRLRTAVAVFMSPFQSAFMPGRQMSDNIVLAEEIVASWRRDDMPEFLWKVDFSKAYDSID